MSTRWHQLVMIGTAVVMIALSLHGNYLRWSKLQTICPEHLKPTMWLWPSELKAQLEVCTEYDKDAPERERLRVRAKRFGIALDEEASLVEWRDEVENKGRHQLLIKKAYAQQERLGFSSHRSLGSIEDDPQIWNLGLLGLTTVQINDRLVMKYEFSQASAWLLGVELRDDCGLFCPVLVSYDDAKALADSLSKMMNLQACYSCSSNECFQSCMGWKLPTFTQWQIFRGDMDQQWEYIAQHENTPLTVTGKRGPNQNGLHDIVGNSIEWSQQGEGLGAFVDTVKLMEKGRKIGFRLYRQLKSTDGNEKK